MKKIMPVILMLLCAGFTDLYSQDRVDAVESFTPSRVMLFVKTSRVKNAVVSLKFVVDNLLSPEHAEKFNKKKNDIKNRLGFDPMDIESLKNAGIDVDRTASLVIYPKGTRGEERILLFIPVMDDKTFPLKFVEVLKRMSANNNADIYPAITEYSGYTMYQIRRDVFATAFDGVFVIGSTGDLLRSVIDTKVNNTGYLALDPMYADYISKTKKDYDLRAFATRDFLKDVMKKQEQKNPKPAPDTGDKKGPADSAFNDAVLTNVNYVADIAQNQPSVRSEMEKLAAGPSPFNSIDYAFIGGSVKPTEIDIDVAARFNIDGGRVSVLQELIKTGASGRSIYVKNATTFAFISLNFNKIEELCKNATAGCAFYNNITERIREEVGIDFDKDIVPSYSGVLNVFAGQPRGAGGGYVFYFPIDDPAQGKKAWEKSSAYLAGKYKNTERYGAVTIGGVKSFWYVDGKNNKNYVSCDRRGLYLGNDRELMGAVMAGKEIGDKSVKDDVISRLGANVFFLAHVKRESYFGTLLTLFTYRARGLSAVINKMTDLYVTGEKIDNFISLNVKTKLMKRQ